MIYFVCDETTGRIKIGTTIQLSVRLKQLAIEHGELRLLAVVAEGRDAEQALHHRFAHLRVINEWFEPGDDLIGFIVAEGNPWDGSDESSATLSVKLRMGAVESARIVAALRGVTITDLISDMIEEDLKRMEREEIEKRARAGRKGGKA